MDRRLEVITTGAAPAPRASAAALCLGFLRYFIAGNPTNAAALAERAADLDPGNTAALPMAVGGWSAGDRQDRAIAAADRWIRTWDQPASRAFRAKVLARANRLDDAEADLRWILARESTNAMARVGLAAVEVLRPDPERVRRASELLRDLEEGGIPRDDKDLIETCRLLRAAALALSGDTPAARRLIFSVLAGAPNHAEARSLMKAVDGR